MSGWAAAAQAISEIGGAVIQDQMNQQSAQRAYDRSLSYLRNAPTHQMEGYRRAGLNPILAVDKMSGISPGGNFASNPSLNLGGAISTAMQAKIQREQLAQQADLVRSQSANQTAQADNQLAQSREAASRQWLNEMTLHNLLPAQAHSAEASATRDHSQALLNQATALHSAVSAKNLEIQNALGERELNSTELSAKIARYTNIANEILRPIGSAASAASSFIPVGSALKGMFNPPAAPARIGFRP